MMFVCPRCGCRELPIWRAHRYFLYVVYCRLDELKEWMPEICERLKDEKDLEFGPYTYHLTSSDYVLRITTELKDFLYKRNLIKKYVAAEDPSQMKLEAFK